MTILIVVEDGTGLPNSNSYADVSDARSFANDRGIVLSVEDDEVAALLIQANDYLEAQSCSYQGKKTSPLQALQWPRKGVKLDGDDLPPNVIPSSLVKAQLQLLLAANDGMTLLPNVVPSDYVTQETVGPITTKYEDMSKVGFSPIFSAVDSLLAPLFGECNKGGSFLKLTRI